MVQAMKPLYKAVKPVYMFNCMSSFAYIKLTLYDLVNDLTQKLLCVYFAACMPIALVLHAIAFILIGSFQIILEFH